MQNGKIALKVSEQIELRLPDQVYVDQLFKTIDQHRLHLRPWLGWVDGTQSSDDIRAFIRTSRLFNKGGQRLTTFIFFENLIVGSISLVKINKDHKFAEIGYWIREDFQGKGIITQSCKSLIDYSFKNFDLNRIEIKVASPNIKSQAIPKRLGFLHEGTLKEAFYIHNTFFDLELFSMLRKDWT